MMKKHVVLTAIILINFASSFCVAEAHRSKAVHKSKTSHVKNIKKPTCPVLSATEKAEAYNILLPDLIKIDNDRINTLTTQVYSMKDANIFAIEFATYWLYATSRTYVNSEGARPDLREDVKTAIERFQGLLCPNRPLSCSKDFSPLRFKEVSMQMLPATMHNFEMRIELFKRFIKNYPQYKAIAVKNAGTWVHIIEAHITKLKVLDEENFTSTIKELNDLVKQLEELCDCTA